MPSFNKVYGQPDQIILGKPFYVHNVIQEKILWLSLYALYKKREQVNDVILTDYMRDSVPILLYVSPIPYHENSDKYGEMWIISDFKTISEVSGSSPVPDVFFSLMILK